MQCIYKLLWLCSARDVAGALSILCPSIIVRILCALRVCAAAGIFLYIGINCCADHAFLCPPNLSFTIHCYAEYAVMAWIHAGMLSTAAATPWGTGTVLTIVRHSFVYWLIKCVTAAPAFNLFCTTHSRDGLHFVAASAVLRRGCPARKRWPLPPVRRMVEQ